MKETAIGKSLSNWTPELEGMAPWCPSLFSGESSSPHKISFSPAIIKKSHERVRLPQILEDDAPIILGAEDIEFVICLQPREYTT